MTSVVLRSMLKSSEVVTTYEFIECVEVIWSCDNFLFIEVVGV